jgi:pre-rRNA-processing protein TSR4
MPATDVEGAVVGEVADDWGGDGGDWGGDGGDDWGADEGAADDLADALDVLATRDSGGENAKKRRDRNCGDTTHAASESNVEASMSTGASTSVKWHGPKLPEFYVLADYEPDAATASALTSSERANAERLLRKYAMEEGLETNLENAGAVIAAAVTSRGGSLNQKNQTEFAAEAYESAVVEGVDGQYLKFSKRVRRAPEQCVRYGFGGHALCWPVDGPPPETKCAPCSACGGKRETELQLVPPLLHFAAQAREWAGADHRRSKEAVSDAQMDAWDWQTVVVMTCSSSCGPSRFGDEGSDRDVFVWREEAVETVDGDSGVAELLRSGQAELPERDAVVRRETAGFVS